jgi:uncharacterized membrane protein YdbT with pleckstrin-like domain
LFFKSARSNFVSSADTGIDATLYLMRLARYDYGVKIMTTHEFVYQTFVVYVFVKALILAPLGWMTFMFWLSERNGQLPSGE